MVAQLNITIFAMGVNKMNYLLIMIAIIEIILDIILFITNSIYIKLLIGIFLVIALILMLHPERHKESVTLKIIKYNKIENGALYDIIIENIGDKIIPMIICLRRLYNLTVYDAWLICSHIPSTIK